MVPPSASLVVKKESWKVTPQSPKLLLDLEFYVAKGLVTFLTKEEGKFEPLLHNHPLYFARSWAELTQWADG